MILWKDTRPIEPGEIDNKDKSKQIGKKGLVLELGSGLEGVGTVFRDQER